MTAARPASRPRAPARRADDGAHPDSPPAKTMEGAILRALAMTGAPATAPVPAQGSEAEHRKGKKAFRSKGKGARASKVEDPATLLDRIRQGTATSGVVASDIVRFRPRGAIDRRIKVDYIADPDHSESVLLRLTPASPADLPTTAADEDLLSSQQAADLLNVSRPYVTKLADAGAFQGVVRTVAGHRRIPRAEVERVRAEMQSTRRTALDEIEEITKDLRIRELEAARTKAKRRWMPGSP